MEQSASHQPNKSDRIKPKADPQSIARHDIVFAHVAQEAIEKAKGEGAKEK